MSTARAHHKWRYNTFGMRRALKIQHPWLYLARLSVQSYGGGVTPLAPRALPPRRSALIFHWCRHNLLCKSWSLSENARTGSKTCRARNLIIDTRCASEVGGRIERYAAPHAVDSKLVRWVYQTELHHKKVKRAKPSKAKRDLYAYSNMVIALARALWLSYRCCISTLLSSKSSRSHAGAVQPAGCDFNIQR